MARTRTVRDVFVSPKVARLREVSGHDGPWTSAEYSAAFGPPLGPSTGPDPDPPAEVAELAELRDVALSEFERADDEWVKALVAERQAQQVGQTTYVDKAGQPIRDEAPRKLRKARKALAEAREVRDEAAEKLRKATAKWRPAEHAWRHQLLAEHYEATKQQ